MKVVHTNILTDEVHISEVYLLIENGVIRDICKDFKGESLDYMDWCLSSCFFNIHCHMGESLYELDDCKTWNIKKYIQYTDEVNSLLSQTEQELLWNRSAKLTASEQLKNGVSGVCAARCASICNQYNQNCMSGYPIMNSSKLKSYKKKGVNGFIEYAHKYKSEKCSIGIFFHSLYSNDIESLEIAKARVDNGAEFVTVHLSEDQETRDMEIQTFGDEPTFVLDKYGLLNDCTIIVHGGYLSNKELKLIKEREATIAVCPISNKTLNTQLPNLNKILDSGINWCIASDGLATGKSFSLLKQTEELLKYFPDISFCELYDACTRNCAKLFRREIYTGRVTIGTEAKFIRHKVNSHLNCFEQILNNNSPLEIIEF